MRFFTAAAAVCVAAFASTVLAAQSTQNPISKPDGSESILAGQPCLIKWTPTTKGSIKLTLRQGTSGDLKDLDVIVSESSNSGMYEWSVPSDLPAGKNYAIMITSANDEDNYTPLLTVDSDAKSKPKSSASDHEEKPSKTADEEKPSKTADEEKPSKTADEEKPSKTSHEEKPKFTGHSNSTITSKKYSNSTTTKHHKSSSPKTTLEPSTTSDASSSASESSTPSSTGAPDSGAMAVVRSPIALVACLVAGFFFLN